MNKLYVDDVIHKLWLYFFFRMSTESYKFTFYPHRNYIKYVWNVKISKENREIKDKNSLQMTKKHA